MKNSLWFESPTPAKYALIIIPIAKDKRRINNIVEGEEIPTFLNIILFNVGIC